MARYSRFKYAAQKYGATSTTTLVWGLQIDWDDDGVFTGENEATRLKGVFIDRGRDYFITPSGDGFEPVQPGQARLLLDNSDRRYDPYNTAGPLYPNVDTGRFIRLIVRYGATVYEVFSGTIQDIIQQGERVEILAEDGLRWLQDQTMESAIYQTTSADVAIGLILTAAKWPALWGSSLQAGADVLDYWWMRGRNGAEEIRAIADSEFGRAFVAADGKMKFYNRFANQTAVLAVNQSQLLADIRVPQPWEVRRNIVQVQSNPIIALSVADIWTASGEYAVDAGNSIELFVEYNTPALSVLQPVAGTDYTAFDQTGGAGTNVTASISVVAEVYGESAKLTITNSSAGIAYLNLLKLRGNPLQIAVVKAQAVGAGADRRPRTLALNLEWQQDLNNPVAFSQQTLDFLATVREQPVVQLENRPALQFLPDLFDAVTVDINYMSISDTFQVGSIQHEWLSENGQSVRTTWRLEPFKEYNYWRFPVTFNTTSILG